MQVIVETRRYRSLIKVKTPRDYQQAAIDYLLSQLDQDGIPTVVSPCGSGKCLIGAKVAEALVARGLRVWLVVPSAQLLLDAKKEIAESCPGLSPMWRNVAYLHAPTGQYDPTSPLILAMEQTLSKRIDGIGDCDRPDVVICDESHRTLYSRAAKEIRRRWPKVKFLALTATPYRLGGLPYFEMSPKSLWFEATTPLALVAQGLGKTSDWILPSDELVAKTSALIAGTEDGDGDYNDSKQTCAQVSLFPEQFEHYQSIPGLTGKVHFWFCVSVEHAQFVQGYLSERGMTAAILTAETPDTRRNAQRTAILDAAREGNLDHVISVDCLTTGINVPLCSVAIFLRATKSTGLFAQMAGRATRPHAEQSVATMIDYGLNIGRHGLPEAIDWATLPDPRQIKDHSHALCAKCGHDHRQIPRPTDAYNIKRPDPDTDFAKQLQCHQCGQPVTYNPRMLEEYAAYLRRSDPSAPFGGTHRGISIGTHADCVEPLTPIVLYSLGVWALAEPPKSSDSLAAPPMPPDLVEALAKSKAVLASWLVRRIRLDVLTPEQQKFVLTNCSTATQIKQLAKNDNDRVRMLFAHGLTSDKPFHRIFSRTAMSGIRRTVLVAELRKAAASLGRSPQAQEQIAQYLTSSKKNCPESRPAALSLINILLLDVQLVDRAA